MTNPMNDNLKIAVNIAERALIDEAEAWELEKLIAFLKGLQKLSEGDSLLTRRQAE